jgi:hypothetical protein
MIKFAKLLLVMLCLIHIPVFGQELKKAEITSDWKLLSEKDGLKLFIKSETCQIEGAPKPFDYVFIKLENSNSEDKSINFQLGVNYNQLCVGCLATENEAQRNIVIPANSTLFGDSTFERGELSYLIANHNGVYNYTFNSIRLIYLNIQ